MAQEVWPSRAKVLVPLHRERGGREVGGTKSLGLQGQSSCATPEGAVRERGRWHKKFGPRGANFLCHPRGSRKDRGGYKEFVPTRLAYSKISVAV